EGETESSCPPTLRASPGPSCLSRPSRLSCPNALRTGTLRHSVGSAARVWRAAVSREWIREVLSRGGLPEAGAFPVARRQSHRVLWAGGVLSHRCVPLNQFLVVQ